MIHGGPYRVVYADPPWQYWEGQPPSFGRTLAPENHYPTMPTEDICRLALPALEKNAVLFLWATSPRLPEALKVIDSWGFQYKASFVWDKVNGCWSSVNSICHEFLLIAVRGRCAPDCKWKLFDSVQTLRRTTHSAKPALFRILIDQLYPHGQRIELFARGTLPKHWDGWGNEYLPMTPEPRKDVAFEANFNQVRNYRS